jgi:hypothetical protein
LIGLQKAQADSQIKLLAVQNSRLDTQNYRINIQNNLLESDRISSLSGLMSNIFDKIDEEIKDQKEERDWSYERYDTSRFYLSNGLITRIIALSRALKPYYKVENGVLQRELISPERGQLLVTLLGSNLDSITQGEIFQGGNFSYSHVENSNSLLIFDIRTNFNLRGIDLKGAYLPHVLLANSDLVAADLSKSNLEEAAIVGADLSIANFEKATLRNAFLNESNCKAANFTDTDLSNVEMIKCNLSFSRFIGSTLTNANIRGSRLKDAIFHNVDFSTVKGLTYDQLLEARSIYKCTGLDNATLERLLNTKPCLQEKKGCK